MPVFTIAIIGKPNVGKSTLFNLLSKKKLAIVENTPGVTVDYKENITRLYSLHLKVIDTGGLTSNNKLNKKEPKTVVNQAINKQTKSAIQLANLVLLVVDAQKGITYEDFDIASKIRKSNKNIVVIVNKVDDKNREKYLPEVNKIGFKNVVIMSALHKFGLQELYKTIKLYYTSEKLENINEKDSTISNYEQAPFLSIAIVGKPNTGKSTLINSLLKSDRLVVSDIPGTTKDSISVYFNYKNQVIKLIDTAGLIRKSKIQKGVDALAKSETIRSIIFTQIVILVIDAQEGITKQDLTLARYIFKEGRALIVLLNKIDLIKNHQLLNKEVNTLLNEKFSHVKGIKVIATSGLKSLNLNCIFKESILIYKKWSTTIKTSLLNKWLNKILINNPPPLSSGKLLKIKYISQDRTRPPTFNLWVNLKTGVPTSYLNFLRNQLYKTFDLWGIPVRFNIKVTKNPYINNS